MRLKIRFSHAACMPQQRHIPSDGTIMSPACQKPLPVEPCPSRYSNTMTAITEPIRLPWKFDRMYGRPQKSDVAVGSCLQVPKEWTSPVLSESVQASTSVRVLVRRFIPPVWGPRSP